MSLQYRFICIIIYVYINLTTAASILTSRSSSSSSTYKPSSLLLPPGFDSQIPPRQPMLYPFAISPSSLPTRASYKSISRTSPEWIPLSLNSKERPPIVPYSTPTLSSNPISVLEDRISYDGMENVSPVYKEGHVFESIVYGTWKPDPPLQPLEILSDKNRQQTSSSISSFIVDGKLYNKTINRQHGGFIGNIPPKPTKAVRQNLHKYENEKSSSSTLSSSLEHKSKESIEMSSEQKLQRKLKKQGRQKIRPISSSTTEQTAVERNSNREEEQATIKTTMMTTKDNIERKQQQQQHQSQTQSQQSQIEVIKVNSTDPKLMEVANQINDSIEFIKYNHKQTSPHSIDMMTTAEEDNINTNTNTNSNKNYANDNFDLGVLKTDAVTEPIEFMSTEPQRNYDDDIANVLESIGATRRSWPTDFEDDPLSSTDAINTQPDYSDLVYSSNDTNAAEISLALSALNIPPSLWPKLPGNITKLGKPYEAKSSDEEPALCVPITVREQNIANSKELIFIERVFCFPMPPSTTSTTTSRSTVRNNVVKAKVQNYDDYIDSKSRISNVATSNFKSQLFLVTTILVLYFKIIV